MMSLLFSRVSIFDVLNHQQERMKIDVNQLDSAAIDRSSEEQLVHDLTSKFKLEIPVLEDNKAYISHREIDVDVSQDPMRMIWDRNQPFYIKGTEIAVKIPFKGAPDLFQVRPQTFNLNPPRGEIRANEVYLVQVRTDNNAAAVKAEYERSVQSIKQHLSWLEGSITDFNSKIGQQVQALFTQRRQALKSRAEMVASIGLPIEQPKRSEDPATQQRTRALNKSTASPKKWDVFISHATEDKQELVRPLAQALQSKGVAVWYDEFSLKLGDSLRASIDYGLANSRFGVVVLSRHFFAKHWPVQELNGLATREVGGNKVILPIWHKVNFEEVREFSPTLADKLASTSGVGVDKLVEGILQVLE
ncbi:MAG: toll/interleukin-1 receptor domain-containing protein [Terriglobales bacterium]